MNHIFRPYSTVRALRNYHMIYIYIYIYIYIILYYSSSSHCQFANTYPLSIFFTIWYKYIHRERNCKNAGNVCTYVRTYIQYIRIHDAYIRTYTLHRYLLYVRMLIRYQFVISKQFPMRYCSTWLRSLLCYII